LHVREEPLGSVSATPRRQPNRSCSSFLLSFNLISFHCSLSAGVAGLLHLAVIRAASPGHLVRHRYDRTHLAVCSRAHALHNQGFESRSFHLFADSMFSLVCTGCLALCVLLIVLWTGGSAEQPAVLIVMYLCAARVVTECVCRLFPLVRLRFRDFIRAERLCTGHV